MLIKVNDHESKGMPSFKNLSVNLFRQSSSYLNLKKAVHFDIVSYDIQQPIITPGLLSCALSAL